MLSLETSTTEDELLDVLRQLTVWKELHISRITSSVFGEVYGRRDETICKRLKGYTYVSAVDDLPPTKCLLQIRSDALGSHLSRETARTQSRLLSLSVGNT